MRLAVVIILVLLIVPPSFASGVLSYMPNPATTSALPGATVDLTAQLKNVGDATLYVNDLSVTLNGQASSFISRNPFFNFFDSVPGTFTTVDPAFTGNLAEILVDPATPPGTYTLTVEIVGGANPSLIDAANNALGTQTFTIVILSSPPPPLVITTASVLPSAVLGVAYSQNLIASGGTPPYSNWTVTAGSLPVGLSLNSATGVISGTPMTVSGTFNFTVVVYDSSGASAAGSFQLTVQPPATSSPLARVGSFAQVASGGGWKTTMTLINLSSVAVNAQVNFYADNGSALILPITFSQFGLSTSTASQSFTVNPNESVVIASEGSSSLAVGWADVQATGALSGYSIFRLRVSGAPDSEGTASLDNRQSSSLVVPYDNINSYRTGVALANLSSSAATITAILLDQNGVQLASKQIGLQALGHASFFVDEQFSQSTNQLGIVQFQSTGGLTGVGLRFSPAGSFTSVPILP